MNDCVKCSYPRGEPKGERVCKKCSRQEGTPKGRATGTLLYGAGGTGIDVTHLSVSETLTPDADPRPEAPPTLPPDLGASLSNALPAHSKMGGSAAHRFLNCTGSSALIAQLKLDPDIEDPDYTRDGHQAHELGARALDTNVDAWELIHEYPQLDPMGAAAVQEYIDYVRSRPGRRRVEVKLHLPELHPAMFSTLDAELVRTTSGVAELGLNPDLYDDGGNLLPIAVLEIVDYKHGIGIYVAVEDNDQLKYYACMAIMEDPTFYDDADIVELTIAQPRITWADSIRTWRTTVGELKHWLYAVLLPAMHLEAKDMHLQMGEWCRFCPAKLVCPAMSQAFAAFSGATDELATMSNEVLGRDYVLSAAVKMRVAAIAAEVKRRLMERVEVPGAKLVSYSADRVWKDKIERDGVEITIAEAARDRFGSDAYTQPKLLSPPQMEKIPGIGKAFVAEWAYFPEAGYAVALATDAKKAVVPQTVDEKYGDPSKYLDAPAET